MVGEEGDVRIAAAADRASRCFAVKLLLSRSPRVASHVVFLKALPLYQFRTPTGSKQTQGAELEVHLRLQNFSRESNHSGPWCRGNAINSTSYLNLRFGQLAFGLHPFHSNAKRTLQLK